MDNEEFLSWLEADPMIEWTDEIIDRLSELTGVTSRGFFTGVLQAQKALCIRATRWVVLRNATLALSK